MLYSLLQHLSYNYKQSNLYTSIRTVFFNASIGSMILISNHSQAETSTLGKNEQLFLSQETNNVISGCNEQEILSQNIAKQKQIELTNKLINSAYQYKHVHDISNSKIEPTNEKQPERLTDWFKNFPVHKDPKYTKNSRCIGKWINPSIDRVSGTNPSLSNITNGEIYAVADYGYYDQNIAELMGNVIVKQGNQLINADQIKLDIKNETAQAQGKVLFTDATSTNSQSIIDKNNHLSNDKLNNSAIRERNSGQLETVNPFNAGIVGVADNIKYSTQDKTAEANHVAFASVPMQAHGYAEKLKKLTPSEYKLQNVTFSTCPPNTANQQWQLEASNIDLNSKIGRGETYNTILRIKNVPVLYLPYFNFPIDDRRVSGFLHPNIRLNTEEDSNGLEVSLPYYLNLAPNLDATITPRIYTYKNPMISGEFRYLTDGYGKGKVSGSFLAKDRKYHDKNRSSLLYEHEWQSESIPHLTANAQFNYVSDSEYIHDFDYLGVVDNELNLPRRIQVEYFDDKISANFKVESYQSLAATDINGNPVKDKDRPYDRLPQFNVKYSLPQISKFDPLLSNSVLNNIEVTGEHDFAYFKKNIRDKSAMEKSGFRMYNSIHASYPFNRPWGYIEPSINLQHLLSIYDEDARIANGIKKEENTQSVFVPQFNIDTQAHFIKNGSPFKLFTDKDTGHQILSPRLKYSYAPYRSQNDIPNFNTGIASVNYDQLYSDSWFLGRDRLQDLHAITPGINYRYIDATGQTLLDASIAQQYYLDSGLVTLKDNKSKKDSKLFSEDSSGIITSISTQPYNNVWLDFDGALNSNHKLSYVTSQLRYQPTVDSQFGLGIVKRTLDENTNQLPLSAVTGSAIFPINDNWRVISQAQYDYKEHKFLDSLFGIDYEDCCLGFSIYGRHYYNDLQLNESSNNAIMAEIRLKGIGSNGRLNKLLSNKIMGIDNINQAWKDTQR